MHTRDAGICNSCGPREETFGQCWQLEMKDRWSGAHLTECCTRVCVVGGWCSESHIIIIMLKSSTQALLDILWCLKRENMLEMFQPISTHHEREFKLGAFYCRRSTMFNWTWNTHMTPYKTVFFFKCSNLLHSWLILALVLHQKDFIHPFPFPEFLRVPLLITRKAEEQLVLHYLCNCSF